MNEDYIIRHIGDGEFEAEFTDGNVKNVGSSLSGMIRYTYFEDFTIPEVGWEVTRSKLFSDYTPKVWNDIKNGEIKIGKHDFK